MKRIKYTYLAWEQNIGTGSAPETKQQRIAELEKALALLLAEGR